GVRCSCGGIRVDHALERVDLVPPRKAEEALVRRGAMREIGLEDAFDRARRLVGRDVAVERAADRGVRPEAAADQHVIALDRISLLFRLHLAGEQTYFADRVLRAGVMTSGEMDVDGRVERDAAFAPGRDVLGVLLGV